MSDNSKLYVVDVGMITPVGDNSDMTLASVQAGISTYKESDFFDDDFNKIVMSVVPEEILNDSLNEDKLIGQLTSHQARLLQLIKPALTQIESIPDETQPPLFLACPEVVNNNNQISAAFINNIAEQCDVQLDINNSRIISTGRAGGLDVINLAMKYLSATGNKYALVGAVDSFHEKNIIDYYLSQERLLTRDSMDGFVPGEGAAFLLLTAQQSSQKEGDLLPYILEPGVDQEIGHMYSKETYTGDGLSGAFSKALLHSQHTKIDSIYSSMNGENHFAKELGVSLIRNKQVLSENYKVHHPSDCFGDLGAAIGIVMLGMITTSLKNQLSSSSYLVCCSSDSSPRSAAVISI